jgi:hypothetical protein
LPAIAREYRRTALVIWLSSHGEDRPCQRQEADRIDERNLEVRERRVPEPLLLSRIVSVYVAFPQVDTGA